MLTDLECVYDLGKELFLGLSLLSLNPNPEDLSSYPNCTHPFLLLGIPLGMSHEGEQHSGHHLTEAASSPQARGDVSS